MSNLVTIPWYDGSEREVEYNTLCLDTDEDYVMARDEGWSYQKEPTTTYPWAEGTSVKAIFTKAEEPPKPPLKLPTAEGAIIAAFKDGKATGWSASLGRDSHWKTYSHSDSSDVDGIIYSPTQLRTFMEVWPSYTFKVIFEGEGSDE